MVGAVLIAILILAILAALPLGRIVEIGVMRPLAV